MTGQTITAIGAAPAAPPAGTVTIYAKADKLMYSKDDAGVETALGGTPPVPFSGAAVFSNAPQVIVANVQTALSFTGGTLDTDTIWDPGFPTRLTVPAGKTLVSLSGQMSVGLPAAGKNNRLTIYKNGVVTVVPYIAQIVSDGNNDTFLQINAPLLSCSPLDYFELMIFSDNIGGVTTVANTCKFNMQVVY